MRAFGVFLDSVIANTRVVTAGGVFLESITAKSRVIGSGVIVKSIIAAGRVVISRNVKNQGGCSDPDITVAAVVG